MPSMKSSNGPLKNSVMLSQWSGTQRTGNIVGGHQRFKVLTQLGEKKWIVSLLIWMKKKKKR